MRGGSQPADVDGRSRDEGGTFTGVFRPRLVRLGSELLQVDLRNFKTLSSDRSWQQIVARASLPIAIRVTRDAADIVSDIGKACAEKLRASTGERASSSSLPPAFLTFEQCMDDAVGQLQESSSVSRIDDIAFLVAMELRQRIDRLSRFGDGAHSNAAAVIGECDSAIRRVRKGLGAIDAAIAAVERVTPAFEFSSELEHSLTVRRAYARFRAYIAASGGDDLASRLRGAFARIDGLADGSVARLIRVGDRLQILELEERIEVWLRRGTHDATEGERLWQDVVGFAEMLAQVNRRQELLEHDRVVLSRLLDGAATPSERRAQDLQSLEGLDLELDQRLASLAGATAREVARAIAPIAARYRIEEGAR